MYGDYLLNLLRQGPKNFMPSLNVAQKQEILAPIDCIQCCQPQCYLVGERKVICLERLSIQGIIGSASLDPACLVFG